MNNMNFNMQQMQSYNMYKSVKKTLDEQNNLNGYKVVTNDDVTSYVPISESNRHYIAIQEWVAEGNKIEDAD